MPDQEQVTFVLPDFVDAQTKMVGVLREVLRVFTVDATFAVADEDAEAALEFVLATHRNKTRL